MLDSQELKPDQSYSSHNVDISVQVCQRFFMDSTSDFKCNNIYVIILPLKLTKQISDWLSMNSDNL